MFRENSGQWEAIFKVNGEEWMSYTQAPDETYEDFEDEVFQIEVELTREAYREFKTRNVTVEIVERRTK